MHKKIPLVLKRFLNDKYDYNGRYEMPHMAPYNVV